MIEIAHQHKDIIYKEWQNAHFLIANKPLLKEIKQKITHEAFKLLFCKKISAKKLVEELATSYQPIQNIILFTKEYVDFRYKIIYLASVFFLIIKHQMRLYLLH